MLRVRQKRTAGERISEISRAHARASCTKIAREAAVLWPGGATIDRPMHPLIIVRDLVFDYPGHRALDGVSFAIEPRTITALVGPNGAGKTTLLRCAAALDTPTAGQVVIAGIDVHDEPRASHRHLGYLADFFGLYDELPVARCLLHHAAAQNVPSGERERAVRRAAGSACRNAWAAAAV